MEPEKQSISPPLAGIWAKKYVNTLLSQAWESSPSQERGPEQTAQKILDNLRFASSQAWSKTEELLLAEVKRHRISPSLIDPWKIAEDSRTLFEQAAESYQAKLTPAQFSVLISPICGRIRRYYTATDPCVLGFMSMQFHYTGLLFLEQLDPGEQGGVQNYLKVMDDHLYIPLQRTYDAAAKHDYHSPILVAVRELLPVTTRLAESICTEVAQNNPNYQCRSGSLNDPRIRISSIRDVEMFQIYLCLSVLEGNVTAIQQELFPLCIMLYPPLQVRWFLVRQMLNQLELRLKQGLAADSYRVFAPALQTFQSMFSEDVLSEDDPIWASHPDAVRFVDRAQELLHRFQ
ncbi:MAG: hypothetical protein MJA27_01915 [Pseudanabaenales cyanobacterium]|nr:hypothetical protein [Pseudanabaenales cyanobacterium]